MRTDTQWRTVAALAREDPAAYRRALAATLGGTTAERLATSVLESDGAPPESLWVTKSACSNGGDFGRRREP